MNTELQKQFKKKTRRSKKNMTKYFDYVTILAEGDICTCVQ